MLHVQGSDCHQNWPEAEKAGHIFFHFALHWPSFGSICNIVKSICLILCLLNIALGLIAARLMAGQEISVCESAPICDFDSKRTVAGECYLQFDN